MCLKMIVESAATFTLIGILSCPFVDSYIFFKHNCHRHNCSLFNVVVLIISCVAAFLFIYVYLYVMQPMGLCELAVRTSVKIFLVAFLFRPFVEFYKYMQRALRYHKCKMSAICMYMLLCLLSFCVYYFIE